MSRVSIGTRPGGAADNVRIEVRGGAALERRLERLAAVHSKPIIRRAMRRGAKVILPVAQSNAPVGATGQLRRAIKVRAAKRSRSRIGITVTLGEGFFLGKTFYGAFQEFGWKTGKRKSNNRRAVPGKHFMERAAKAAGPAAGKVTIAAIWSGLKARALMGGGLGGGAV